MPLQVVFLIPFLTKFQWQNEKNLLSQWGSFSLWKFLEQVARVGGNFFTFWCRKLGAAHCIIHWWYEENYTFNIIFKSWIIFTIAISIKSYDICLTPAQPHSPCPTSHNVSQGFFGPGAQSIQLQPPPSFDTNWFLRNECCITQQHFCSKYTVQVLMNLVWKIFNIRLARRRKRSIRQRRLFEATISFIIWVQNPSPSEVSMVSRNIKQYGFSWNILPGKQNHV